MSKIIEIDESDVSLFYNRRLAQNHNGKLRVWLSVCDQHAKYRPACFNCCLGHWVELTDKDIEKVRQWKTRRKLKHQKPLF